MDRNIVNWSDTSQIIDDIIRQHENITGLPAGQIILVGGSAMLAHSIRISSGDVDIYSPDLDADIVFDTESKLKKKFGDDFRIDMTPTENLWGNLLIRDIAIRSPLLRRVETSTSCWDIKALDVETLFLVKLEAGRKKDMEDLVAIANKTNPERLILRFNEMVRWHGLPDTVMGYADRFIEKLHEIYTEKPANTIEMIKSSLSKHVSTMLSESWLDSTNQCTEHLELALRELQTIIHHPAIQEYQATVDKLPEQSRRVYADTVIRNNPELVEHFTQAKQALVGMEPMDSPLLEKIHEMIHTLSVFDYGLNAAIRLPDTHKPHH